MVSSSRQQGFTATELLVASVLAALLLLASTPPLVEALRNSRVRAATRQFASDTRQARSKAVATGWEYRIAGFSAGATSTHRNQYRIMSRNSTAIAWPPETTAAFESASQIVGEWIDLDRRYPGVAVNPQKTGGFALTFDARGIPTEKTLDFDPLRVSGESGAEKFVTVSAVGAVRIE